jgi:hypothetical protein
LFDWRATSPRPDRFSYGRCAQCPSRVAEGHRAADLPFTAASTASDFRSRGDRTCPFLTRSVSETATIPSSPSRSAYIARHELVFGRPRRIATTMQSCASAAKLRGGGPILNRGAKAVVQRRVVATSVRHLQIERRGDVRLGGLFCFETPLRF